MPHVVTEPCLGCKNTVCVTVCPVNCFHEDKDMLVIDPVECIDCGACVPECPTKAIFPAGRVPTKWKSFIKVNAEKARVLPLITKAKKPMSGPGS